MLSDFEKDTIFLLNSMQKTVRKIDCSWMSIKDASQMLVELTKMSRTIDSIVEMLPQTPVYHEDGRFLGSLINNEEVSEVVLSARIRLNSKIRALESHIRCLTSRMIIC